jgi:hypothetical protein
VNDPELLAYIDKRRQALQGARARAVHQNGEWAADGALHELDRLAAWINLNRAIVEIEAGADLEVER